MQDAAGQVSNGIFKSITLGYDSNCLQGVLKHFKTVYACRMPFLKGYCFMTGNFRWHCNKNGYTRQSYS